MRTRYLVSAATAWALAGVLTGCSAISTALIPPHPASFQSKGKEALEPWKGLTAAVRNTPFSHAAIPASLIANQSQHNAGKFPWPSPSSRAITTPANLALVAEAAKLSAKEWAGHLDSFCSTDKCRDYETARRHYLGLRSAHATCTATPQFALGAPALAAVGGVAIDLLSKGAKKIVETEAGYYEATYSARTSAPLATATPGAAPNWDQTTRCLIFTRTVKGSSQPSFSLIVQLEIQNDGTAMRVIPQYLEISKSKSKVAALTLERPWGLIEPWMWFHWLYGLFPTDLYKLDMSAKLSIDSIATTKDKRSLMSVGEVELPIGKVDIRKFPLIRTEKDLASAASGYMPVPAAGANAKSLWSNFAVSVVEKGDLGDVIGKAEGLIDDKEDDIRSKLEDWLGVD